MTKQMIMLKAFEPLFKPNRPQNEIAKFDDPTYRRELISRMLKGEKVSAAEFGAKTFVLLSGRVSGKTQHDEFAAARELPVGRGDMWYCRSELGDIRNSIFTSMQNSIYELGFTLSDSNRYADYHVSRSPFELTHNRTGNKIQFFAINKDINRTKGFVAPSGKLKRVMVEEANEVDDPKYLEALKSTAVRYYGGDTKVTFRLNPPETKQHWSVRYFDDLLKEDGTRKIYTTWEDLAKINVLPPAAVAEIIKMRDTNPLFYRYWYLGEIVKLTGLVFPQFERERHCVHIDDYSAVADIVDRVIVAGDAANKNDATCFGYLCVLIDGSILLLDAMYYDPQENGQLDDVALAQMTCDWFDGVLAKYSGLSRKKHFGTVDNANWNLMKMLELSNAMGWFRWSPATDKHIVRDINRLRTLFRQGTLKLNLAADNAVDCVVKEIEGFVYDEKTGEIKRNQPDHGIDMLKYGTLPYVDTQMFF